MTGRPPDPGNDEAPRVGGASVGSGRNAHRPATPAIRHASDRSVRGDAATPELIATLTEKVGAPETHIPGQLRWRCPLPGHTGYPALVVRADAAATTWTCLGVSCGSGDVQDLLRRLDGGAA